MNSAKYFTLIAKNNFLNLSITVYRFLKIKEIEKYLYNILDIFSIFHEICFKKANIFGLNRLK